jgi:hypothetical protein
MSFPLSYCPRGDATISRLRRLFVERDPGLILASMQLPSRVLEAFARQHSAGYCAYPDPQERIAFWDAYLCERIGIEDDSLPTSYPSEMDQGLYGGLLGGDVRFICDPATGWISSMVPPLLDDWANLDRLSFAADSPWAQRYLRQLDVFVAGAQGKFGISHFILINGLNLVFELVGATNTYLALLDQPKMVERALDLAFQLNLWVQNTFFERVPLLEGGACSTMVQWMPGRILSESVDPFHMASVDYFERWGRRTLERIFAKFDGGVTHIHGNGRHLLEAVSTVQGLKALYLGDDKGFPPAFDILPEIRQRVGDLPLVVGVEYLDFLPALQAHHLPGGVFYRVSNVPNLDAANRSMEQVRAYRA